MVLFANKQEANLHVCVKLVEDAITALGHAPEKCRITGPEADIPAWMVVKGAAHVFIGLGVQGSENILRVRAPVLHIVSGTDEIKLFRRLLELNAGVISGAAFGIQGSNVVLGVSRSTVDLDLSEVHDAIGRVLELTDQYEDVLCTEFGARPAGASTMPL